MKKTYEKWYAETNAACERMFGLSLPDLPDCRYRDWYDDGVEPEVAAKDAWAEAWQ